MKLEMNNYLYHGLNYDICAQETLEKILKSGYIYTRNSLKKYLTNYYYSHFLRNHTANWNGEDSVSLACHPNNRVVVDNYNLERDHHDNAFDEFINGTISLVLDTSLLECYDIKMNSLKMNYELQVLGDIPIDFIKAIAININNSKYSSKDLYNLRKVILEITNFNKGKNFNKYYNETYYIRDDLSTHSVEYILKNKVYPIYRLVELIDSCNINIPIVDIKYGNELVPIEKQYRRLNVVAKKYAELQKRY